MAATFGTKTFAIDRLLDNPQSFDFFQAVRLVELTANNKLVCSDGLQTKQIVSIKFHSSTNSNYTIGYIDNVNFEVVDHQNGRELIVLHIYINFFGLTGSNGVMPHHYSDFVALQYKQGNHAVIDFLDIINHQLISLLYASWKKNNALVNFELTKSTYENKTNFTTILSNMIGLGFESAKNRLQVSDENLFFYSEQFSMNSRPATSLARLLTDYFKLSITIEQFQGQWLSLQDHDFSCLWNKSRLNPNTQCLGSNLMLGRRSWNIECKIRINIHCKRYNQYENFMPGEISLLKLIDLVQLYIGLQFDFELCLELPANQLPRLQLSSCKRFRLGLNSWLNLFGHPKLLSVKVIRPIY